MSEDIKIRRSPFRRLERNRPESDPPVRCDDCPKRADCVKICGPLESYLNRTCRAKSSVRDTAFSQLRGHDRHDLWRKGVC